MKMEMKVSTIVKPAAETPGGSIWLSNLDLLMPATYHTQAVSFYRSNGAANFFDATVLKEALSRALVEFYPYAGRLRRGANNRLEIDCNGKGVLFVEAECDASVDDFTSDFIPNSDLNLIPTVDYSQGISTFPLMIIQLTRFKCGGVCFGVAKEHHVSDGVSGLHLLFTWSHLVRGLTFGFAPIFDRSLLAARNPPRPSFSHIEYQPPPALTTPLLIQNDSETTFSMFKITRYQMNALKAKSNDGNALLNYTSYEAFAGHVWRCVCMARGLPPDQETKLHMPVDGRSRLKPALPLTFFGNVIFSATPVALSGELVANPLKFAVGKVHDAIARLDDEYLRSALDYLELQGDVSAIARGTHTTRCPNLGIISWAKLPIYSADYGWGKPVYSGFGAAPHEGKSYLLPCPENDGSLLYGLTLLKPHMEVFKKLIYDI